MRDSGAMHSISPLLHERRETTQTPNAHALTQGVAGEPPGYFGVPIVEWARPTTNAIGCQFHLDQPRFVKVRGYNEVNQTISIPLIDDDGIPFCDPSIPPMMSGHKADAGGDFGTDQYFSSSSHTYWTDCRATAPEFDFSSMMNISLKPATYPVPHWILQVEMCDNSGTVTSVRWCVDLISNGCGALPTNVDEGSGLGHYQVWNQWTGHLFMVASDKDVLYERQYVYGRHNNGVAIAAVSGFTTQDLEDLSNDNMFARAYAPMGRVFRHLERNTTPASAAEWAPCSYGHGQTEEWGPGAPPVPPWHPAQAPWGYSARHNRNPVFPYPHRLDVNFGNTSGTGTCVFYLCAVGRRETVGSFMPPNATGAGATYAPWTSPTAGTASYNEMAKLTVLGEMTHTRVRVHLTTTGEPGATSLLHADHLPYLEVLASDENDNGVFTTSARHGLMFSNGVMAEDQSSGAFYYTLIRSDNALVVPAVSGAAHWMLEIWPRGVVEGGGGGHGRRRSMVVHVLGAAA